MRILYEKFYLILIDELYLLIMSYKDDGSIVTPELSLQTRRSLPPKVGHITDKRPSFVASTAELGADGVDQNHRKDRKSFDETFAYKIQTHNVNETFSCHVLDRMNSATQADKKGFSDEDRNATKG